MADEDSLSIIKLRQEWIIRDIKELKLMVKDHKLALKNHIKNDDDTQHSILITQAEEKTKSELRHLEIIKIIRELKKEDSLIKTKWEKLIIGGLMSVCSIVWMVVEFIIKAK